MAMENKKWRKVKAQIISQFGSIGECARSLKVSPESLRITVHGKCPRIKARLEEVLK